MAFQTPITIKTALDRVQSQEYVLPSIQREFVWKPDQICGLFDSLMQGYPIGSFLFWRMNPETTEQYTFYGVLRDYHALNNRHCPVLDLATDRERSAILDGQQRLTSLNIGLRGSHAEKEPRKWWKNPDAYRKKELHLNLSRLAGENELGLKWDFKFIEAAKAKADEESAWFRVADVMGFTGGKDIFAVVKDLPNSEAAYDWLDKLYTVVHKDGLIPFFEETEQDLEKVLNIFIRVNSGGTPLSYSDLLLSIATAQWQERDAREDVHRLVDELNETGHGFGFSKDLVLKAGLVLTDIPSIAFRVTNFNAENMATLEEHWEAIGTAMRLTATLFSDFGFSGQTLTADSVVIPVAYYIYRRGNDDKFLTSPKWSGDREAIRRWVCRSLLKPGGVWGSGLDQLLLAIRAAIKEQGGENFPVEAIETAMAKRGKSLRFDDPELEELLDIPYGDRKAFVILSLLFHFIDLRQTTHVDHVFPRARFTSKRLLSAGVEVAVVEDFKDQVDRLANLQLLQGPENQAKQKTLPREWLDREFTDQQREEYCSRYALGDVPDSVLGFDDFYQARRDRLGKLLRQALGMQVRQELS